MPRKRSSEEVSLLVWQVRKSIEDLQDCFNDLADAVAGVKKKKPKMGRQVGWGRPFNEVDDEELPPNRKKKSSTKKKKKPRRDRHSV
jgi:hypothetical protein